MKQQPNWQAAPSFLSIAENRVDIWRTRLDLPINRVEQFKNILSEDEIKRGDRFYKLEHQNRFVVCRGVLRSVLSRYLDLAPQALKFEYGEQHNQSGKPRLAQSCGGDWLQFNVSHSDDLAVYAVTKSNLVGIDLEHLRPFPSSLNIAKRFFSAAEYQSIKSLSKEQQLKAFFQIWTVKEAYLKATGEGLAGGLEKVEVSLNYQQNETMLSTKIIDSSSWIIYNFIPAIDYTGTVAVKTRENCNNSINFSYINFD